MAANDASPPVTRSKSKALSSSSAVNPAPNDAPPPAAMNASNDAANTADGETTTPADAVPLNHEDEQADADVVMTDRPATPGPSDLNKGKGPAADEIHEPTFFDEATVETMLRDQQETHADEVNELETQLAAAQEHIKRQAQLLSSTEDSPRDRPPVANNDNDQPAAEPTSAAPAPSVPVVAEAPMSQVLDLLKDMKTHFESQIADLRTATSASGSSSRKRPLADSASLPHRQKRTAAATAESSSSSTSSAPSSAAATASTAPTTAPTATSVPPSGPEPATEVPSIPGLSPEASKAAFRLMNDPSHPAFGLTAAEVSKARLKARPDGPQPKGKLSTSDVKEYRHWAFTLQLRWEQNWAYYLTDSEKIAYALTWLDGELFTSLDAWRQDTGSSSSPRTYDAFLEEVQSYIGFDYQQIDAKSALDAAYQLPTESVAQYYARLHALWSIASTPEEERVSKFRSSIHNSLHFALMQPFSTVKEMRDKAIEVERYRKARALERSRIPNMTTKDTRPDRSNGVFGSQKLSFRNSDRRNAGGRDVLMPTAADKAFNKRFGSCVEKPLTWAGPWWNPDPSPNKTDTAGKRLLISQARCWACRGSGHRSGDSCCPYVVRKTTNSAGSSNGKTFSSMPTAPAAPAPVPDQPALVSDPE